MGDKVNTLRIADRHKIFMYTDLRGLVRKLHLEKLQTSILNQLSFAARDRLGGMWH